MTPRSTSATAYAISERGGSAICATLKAKKLRQLSGGSVIGNAIARLVDWQTSDVSSATRKHLESYDAAADNVGSVTTVSAIERGVEPGITPTNGNAHVASAPWQ